MRHISCDCFVGNVRRLSEAVAVCGLNLHPHSTGSKAHRTFFQLSVFRQSLAFALLLFPALAQAQIRSPFPETPHPAVARIIAPEENGVSFGSGTLVYSEGKYGVVVTNWHVVRDATDEIQVAFPGGFRTPATVAKVDRDWDLAALIVFRPSVDPVRVAQVAPRPGDSLTIAGYGSGNYRSSRGRCTQYVAPAINLPYEMVEVSTEARQGDSGGPIFNDRDELAGVLFGAGHGTTSGSYAGRVRWFLASVVPNLDSRDYSNIAAASPPVAPEREAAPIVEPVASLAPLAGASLNARDTRAEVTRPAAIGQAQATESGGLLPPTLYEPPPAGESSPTAPVAETAGAAPWQTAVDGAMLDHVKTFLALFGVISFAYHAMRAAC